MSLSLLDPVNDICHPWYYYFIHYIPTCLITIIAAKQWHNTQIKLTKFNQIKCVLQDFYDEEKESLWDIVQGTMDGTIPKPPLVIMRSITHTAGALQRQSSQLQQTHLAHEREIQTDDDVHILGENHSVDQSEIENSNMTQSSDWVVDNIAINHTSVLNLETNQSRSSNSTDIASSENDRETTVYEMTIDDMSNQDKIFQNRFRRIMHDMMSSQYQEFVSNDTTTSVLLVRQISRLIRSSHTMGVPFHIAVIVIEYSHSIEEQVYYGSLDTFWFHLARERLFKSIFAFYFTIVVTIRWVSLMVFSSQFLSVVTSTNNHSLWDLYISFCAMLLFTPDCKFFVTFPVLITIFLLFNDFNQFVDWRENKKKTACHATIIFILIAPSLVIQLFVAAIPIYLLGTFIYMAAVAPLIVIFPFVWKNFIKKNQEHFLNYVDSITLNDKIENNCSKNCDQTSIQQCSKEHFISYQRLFVMLLGFAIISFTAYVSIVIVFFNTACFHQTGTWTTCLLYGAQGLYCQQSIAWYNKLPIQDIQTQSSSLDQILNIAWWI